MNYQTELIKEKIYKLNKLINYVNESEKNRIKKTVRELEKMLLFIEQKQKLNITKTTKLECVEQDLILKTLEIFKDVDLLENDYYPVLSKIILDDNTKLNIVEDNLFKMGFKQDFIYNLTSAEVAFVKKGFFNKKLDSQVFKNYYENKDYYGLVKTDKISDLYNLNYLISQGYKFENNNQDTPFDENKIFAETINCYFNDTLTKYLSDANNEKELNYLKRHLLSMENHKYQALSNDHIIFTAIRISNVLKHYSISDINLAEDIKYLQNYLYKIIGQAIYEKSFNDKNLINKELNESECKFTVEKLINLDVKETELLQTCKNIKDKQKENEHIMRKVLNR